MAPAPKPAPKFKKIILATGIAPTHLFAKRIASKVKSHLEQMGHEVELREFGKFFNAGEKRIPWYKVPNHFIRRYHAGCDRIAKQNRNALVVPFTEDFQRDFEEDLSGFLKTDEHQLTQDHHNFGWVAYSEMMSTHSPDLPIDEESRRTVPIWISTPKKFLFGNPRILAGHQERLYYAYPTMHDAFVNGLIAGKGKHVLTRERKPRQAPAFPRDLEKFVFEDPRNGCFHFELDVSPDANEIRFKEPGEIDRRLLVAQAKDGRLVSKSMFLHDLVDGVAQTDLNEVKRLLGKEGEERYAHHLATYISRKMEGARLHPESELFKPSGVFAKIKTGKNGYKVAGKGRLNSETEKLIDENLSGN